MKYALKVSDKSKIAAVYAQVCLPGMSGAPLITSGFSQAAFTMFVAKVALAAAEKGLDENALASQLEALAACNASQARQAIGSLLLVREGEREQSVAEFWGKAGGKPAAGRPVDLSLFGLAAPEGEDGGGAS